MSRFHGSDCNAQVLIDTMTNVRELLESCVAAECEYVVLKVAGNICSG